MSRQTSSIPRPFGPLQTFHEAVSLHEQGRLWEAAQLYEAVLKADDRHFDAVYRLGLVRLQQGKFAEAAALLRRAAKLDKRSADAQFHLAVAVTGTGKPQDAIAHYEKALLLKRNFAEAHNNFGHALQILGRHEAAAAQYEKALAINPAYAEARNNLANALQMLGRSEQAIAQYWKALAIRPNYAEAYHNLGNVLATLGRHEEAIANYEKALTSRPRYVQAHYSLGKSLGALGRHEEAIGHFEQALAIEPSNAEIHNTLSNLLFVLGRVEEALAHAQEALAAEPEHIGAHNNLGLALRALGRLDDAIHAFEKAIALAPTRGGGYLNLVGSRRLAAGDPHLTAMTEIARNIERLGVDEQIGIHFALGKALSDIGDRQQSFRHLVEGNSLKRRQIAYDEARSLERFERIRAVFTTELMRGRQGQGDPSRAPVFVVGMPRSGTSLVEQILASHPEVFGAGELRELDKLVSSIAGPDGSEFPEAVPSLAADRLRELGASYLQAVRRLAPAAERITDKMPANFVYAGLIRLGLPNARIIHTRRDPRDTALSCFSILFAYGQDHTYDLAELGRYYRAYEGLMEHWRKLLPASVMLEVQYEDMVDDVEEQARRIVAHCELDWNDACLAYYKTERPVQTASVTQVRQPIYRSSVGRWRAYEDQLQPFVQALQGA